MQTKLVEKRERESGIELLKIIAIIMIVLHHVAQTFGTLHMDVYPEYSKYFVDLNIATTNIQQIIITFFWYAGELGNDIFFICSAWFLVDSKNTKLKKVLHIIADVWLVSIVILAFTKVGGVPIGSKDFIKSLFPTTFANNWYITAYILIYAIHPAINWIIEKMSKMKLLSTVCILSFLYLGICTVKPDLLFTNNLVTFVVIYFIVSYVKKYLHNFTDDIRTNAILLIVNTIVFVTLVLITDYLGLNIPAFSDKLLRWDSNQNFLLVGIAIALFNLFKCWRFVNKKINYISGLSLLIYIIHENILVVKYLRPLFFIWIKNYLGYSYIVIWVVLLALMILLVSALLATLYKKTLQKLTGRFVTWIEPILRAKYSKIIDKLMELN